jgi:hypothetical protein
MKMKGGKVFCTLDVHQAYLHMGMTEEAAKMQNVKHSYRLLQGKSLDVWC